MKRVFDLVFSFIGLVLLSPLFFLVALIIRLDDFGQIFYLQERVGLCKKVFKIYKFRTMKPQSDLQGLLTVGVNDQRITRFGYHLRKYKVDELPQLINVLKGEMSFVGPRPEVKRFVDYYSKEQLKVFSVKPGMTDKASIIYRNESDLLAQSKNSEQYYLDVVMPNKLKINLEYIEKNNIWQDIFIIVDTIKSVVLG